MIPDTSNAFQVASWFLLARDDLRTALRGRGDTDTATTILDEAEMVVDEIIARLPDTHIDRLRLRQGQLMP